MLSLNECLRQSCSNAIQRKKKRKKKSRGSSILADNACPTTAPKLVVIVEDLIKTLIKFHH